jgi:hypothetical protein
MANFEFYGMDIFLVVAGIAAREKHAGIDSFRFVPAERETAMVINLRKSYSIKASRPWPIFAIESIPLHG